MSDSPGPGVDDKGHPVIDPTANVLALVHAANQRQDDLREAERRHVREIMAMDRAHAADLRLAEAARLDAIRVVDVNAVQRAAEVMATQAQTLATAVATTEATLRKQNEDTAKASDASIEAKLAPMMADIRELRRAQDQAAGGRASTREGEGDRRAGTGVVLGVLAAVMTFVFAVTGVVLTLFLR